MLFDRRDQVGWNFYVSRPGFALGVAGLIDTVHTHSSAKTPRPITMPVPPAFITVPIRP
jgi:hypothetical protein